MSSRALGPLLLMLFALPAGAAPAQYGVWGTAGPDLPPPPKGWQEAPSAAPPGALSPTAAETAAGFVVLVRDPLAVADLADRPGPADRGWVQALTTQGEYEPLAFTLYPLRDLGEVGLAMGPLKSAEGGIISAEELDLRVVRSVRTVADGRAKTYRRTPWLLEKRATVVLSLARPVQVWLTVHIPDDAKPGDYVGAVQVQPAGGQATHLPILLRVLGVKLPPCSAWTAMYADLSDDEAMMKRELTDLREHGIVSGGMDLGAVIQSRDRIFGEDDIAATRERTRKVIRNYEAVFGRPRFPVGIEVDNQITCYWDQKVNWSVFWPHSEEINSQVFRAFDVIMQECKAAGWDKLQAFLIDEAGAHNLLDEAVYYYRLVKQHYPELQTWTDIGGGMAMGFDEIGKLSPWVDFLNTNRFPEDIARQLVDRGKPYGIYNGCGSTPAGARLFFGFYAWKTGAGSISQWAYNFGKDSIFKGGGLRSDDDGYVYYGPDGPIPSIMWEAVREGVKDYRAADRLWSLIPYAQALNTPEGTAAAKSARETLLGILGQTGWNVQAMTSDDRAPAPDPAALRKWRWAVLEQIQKIEALGPLPVIHRIANPPARSPFDYPWAAPPKPLETYGPELLPQTGFGATMAPWHVEAWNGKGVGTLTGEDAHGSKQSARIEIPPGESSQACTVLVWPSWGGSKVTVSLEADRVYEMSAWVKVRDRLTTPDLRCSVPDTAVRSTRTGKSAPDERGWRRIWTRLDMAAPCTPTYLAVWVQGPGTVWVDDLSLREVVPPPLEVTADQAAYDDADKSGALRVSLARRLPWVPLSVRCTLVPANGAPVASLVGPYRSTLQVAAGPPPGDLRLLAPVTLAPCEFRFSPARLPLGEYTATVELLGAGEQVLASAATSFRRVASPFE